MPKRILLADDSVTIQKVVEYVLAEEDFDVRIANDGGEASALAAAFMPDVVLADIDMPVKDGYILCKEIKSNPATAHIPVLLLAGAFEPIDRARMDESGADDYIVKPFESAELTGKINVLLSRTETKSPDEAFVATEEDQADAKESATEAEAAFEAGNAEETAILSSAADADDNRGIAVATESEDRTASEEFLQSAEASAAGFSFSGNLPSVDKLEEIFRQEINEGIVKPLLPEIRDAVVAELSFSAKNSAEDAVRTIMPGLAEKLLAGMFENLAVSIADDIEKVIRESVPGIAEAVITKEIQRIKSEL